MLANIMDTPIDETWYRELLEYFEMEKYELSKLSELSAGQRERVSLIRTFVHEPQIIILDEPGSHLDELLQDKLLGFIAKYHKEHHTTFVISSHGEFADSFFDTFIDFHADYHISTR
jgi:ABC-type multidrug transport system ATPase subunit